MQKCIARLKGGHHGTEGLSTRLVPVFNEGGMRLRRLLTHAVVIVAVLVGSVAAARAALTFTPIDFPGTNDTVAYGINGTGRIVGAFRAVNDIHGYLLQSPTFIQLDVPGAATTRALGINAAGQIVGEFCNNANCLATRGFLLSNGVFTPINVPGAIATVASGINAVGQIVGTFTDASGKIHGFLLASGAITQIDVPGATGTGAAGINAAGQIVGTFKDASGKIHGFLLASGIFTQLDVPFATRTVARGINAAGQIVGTFTDAKDHGFLLASGIFTQLDVPGANFTEAYGINDAGQIVGFFGESIGANRGFLATVCGDGAVDLGEQCDDGNLTDGDGCSAICQIEPPDADGDGVTVAQGDCDDTNPAIHPGATEVCNAKDDNCDGQIDEGVKSTFYQDADLDGFGNPAATTQACSAPAGYVTNNTDCNDTTTAIHPGATEICDSVDNNCNGQVDEGLTIDADQDGFSTPGSCTGSKNDCNDTTTAIHPGATEICDGVDNNCNGQVDEGLTIDADQDGFSTPGSCTGSKNDCNDATTAIHPGAAEVCNGTDDNCNGQIDEGVKSTFSQDSDADGFGNPAATTQACSAPPGYVPNNTDCNDANIGIHPGAAEVCNKLDDNCNGQIDEGLLCLLGAGITVLSPNGGETWPLGTTQSIRWQTQGVVVGGVTIELSRNGGGSWTTLFTPLLNSGQQSWQVTGPATGQALIRVRSTLNGAVADISNQTFTIR